MYASPRWEGRGRRAGGGGVSLLSRLASHHPPTHQHPPSHLQLRNSSPPPVPPLPHASPSQVRQGIQRELQRWSRGASAGPPPSLPVLKCDTSVLDLEEDRVIWVRESELGKGVGEVP
jgi:hypothetical protein